jgi:hypothetical protein
MQIENAVQPLGWKIALCGVALMLIGVALGAQTQRDNPAGTVVTAKDARGMVPLVPSVVGAVLTFLGAIRISLATRPLRSAALGFVLVVVVSTLPLAAAELFPELKTYRWTVPSVLPLFVFRIVGLIFLSTGVLRLLSKARDRT